MQIWPKGGVFADERAIHTAEPKPLEMAEGRECSIDEGCFDRPVNVKHNTRHPNAQREKQAPQKPRGTLQNGA